MSENQKGFGVIEVLIALVMLGLIGLTIWVVYVRNRDSVANNSSSQNVNKNSPSKVSVSDYIVLRLANNKVAFEVPKAG
jgi:prepilin-type N-terminal cleavage/methylation domain-containing protein